MTSAPVVVAWRNREGGQPVCYCNCVVFEDSFHGRQAGNAAGMTVVDLSTTNLEEVLCSQCARVNPNFEGVSYADMKDLLLVKEKEPFAKLM